MKANTVFNHETKESYNIDVIVSDGSLTFTKEFTIVITDVNESPSFTSNPVLSATEGSLYTYNVTTLDPDADDVVTISLDQSPSWLSINNNVVSGTPSLSDVGSGLDKNKVILNASDGSLVASQEYIINVVDSTVPVITSNIVSSINDELTALGSVSASEPVTWSISVGSEDVSIDTDGTLSLNAEANHSISSSHSFTVKAVDGSGNEATLSSVVSVIDITPPVITLSGSASITVEKGDTYVDAGATAIDNSVTDISSSIEVVNAVDMTTPGTYTITYNVQDASGNAAAEVTRTVIVQDTTAPVITLIGNGSVTVEKGDAYVEAGATALDYNNVNLTDDIAIVNPVDSNKTGTYTVTYNVQDAAGNNAVEVTRTVIVQDTIAPVITLIGNATVTVEKGDTYTDAGATALDYNNVNLTDEISIVNPVDVTSTGSYTIRYNVQDDSGNNATEVTRTVVVEDTTAPVITLLGVASITVEKGDTYTDAGASALDYNNVDLSNQIEIQNPVNMSVTGTYTITYNVQDSSGNSATEVTRTVIVQDTTAPVITLLGSPIVTVEKGDVYTDAGATALDYNNVNLTSAILVENPVDMSTPGTYTVTYNVKDSSNNSAAQVTRTVIVQDTTIPVITLTGDAIITIEKGSIDQYNDQGATASDYNNINLDSAVTLSGDVVNTNVVGTYTLRYNVTDDYGNHATEVTRVVNIVDTTAPVISLVGNEFITIEKGTSYIDQGATASDQKDDDLTQEIDTTNPVDTDTLGIYVVTYNVKDQSNNQAIQVTRTVTVVDITLSATSIKENEAIGTEIGTLSSYTSNESLQYSVNDTSNFSITGATLKSVQVFNYESKSSYPIEITVTDGANVTYTKQLIVTIDDVNEVPTVQNPLQDVEVNEDDQNTVIDISNVFLDVDGNDLTFTVTSSDESVVAASLNGFTLTLSYLANQYGSSIISVTATETDYPDHSSSSTFNVTVNPQTDVVTLVTPVSDQTVDEDAADTTIDISSVFSNIDGDLVIAASNDNEDILSATVSEDYTSLVLSYLANKNGEANITLTATQTSVPTTLVTTTFKVTVNAIADIPVLNASINDVTLLEDASDYEIDISNTFINNDEGTAILNIAVSNTNMTLLNATVSGSTLTISLKANQYGADTITVRATSSSDPSLYLDHSFNVTVTSVNDPPVINGINIADIEVTFGAPASVYDITGYSITDVESDAFTSLSVLSTNLLIASPVLDGNTLTISYPKNYGMCIVKLYTDETDTSDKLRGEISINVNVLPPTDYILTGNQVDNTYAIGTIVGTLAPDVEEDDTDSYSFSIIYGEDDVQAFAIENVNQLRTAITYDFAQTSFYEVFIRITNDTTGIHYTRKTIISVLPPPVGSVTGALMDGYISGATGKLVNWSVSPPVDVETFITDAYGNYTLVTPLADLPDVYEIVFVGGTGTDITSGKAIETTFSTMTSKVESPTGLVHVTPLTSLVAQMSKSSSSGAISTTSIGNAKSKVSNVFGVDEGDINTNFITNENGVVAKQAIQIQTTLDLIKSSISNAFVTNDVILSKLVDKVESASSSSDFKLSEISDVTGIIDDVASEVGITVSANAKTNIATYATNINGTISNIESDQSIAKVIGKASQISIASTEILNDAEEKPDFESDTTSFSTNLDVVTQQVQTNAAKLIVSNTNIIGGTFIFKMNKATWDSKGQPLPIINDGAFYKLEKTFTEADPDDEDRTTITVVYEFNPNKPGKSGVYFGGRYGKFQRDTSLEVTQWGKIPLSKGGGIEYGNTGTYEGYQFGYYDGKMTAEDTPTILKATMGSYMFLQAKVEEVTNINLWEMSNVINMDSMFHFASNFKSTISNWDTSNVTSMNSMFYGAGGIGDQPLYWDTSHITDMFEMFMGSNFNGDISKWDTSRLTFANAVFQGASSFNQPIDTTVQTKPNGTKYKAWDVSNIRDFRLMFKQAYAFDQSLNNWDMSRATRLYHMFERATWFNGDITGWDTRNVTNTNEMFLECRYFNQDLSNWDMSKVGTTKLMFGGATRFNCGGNNDGLKKWNIHENCYTQAMFAGTALEGYPSTPSTTFWDRVNPILRPLANISGTFVYSMPKTSYEATNFSLPISGSSFTTINTTVTETVNDRVILSVSFVYEESIISLEDDDDGIETKVTDGLRFNGINSTDYVIHQFGKVPLHRSGRQFVGFKGAIEAQDTPTILYGTSMENIFLSASIAEVSGIHLWDTSEVIDMRYAFFGAKNFNANISTWQTDLCLSFDRTFFNAESFNQNVSTKEVIKDGSTYIAWNTKHVESMYSTFYGAHAFNNNDQEFYWSTFAVKTFESMFRDATSFNKDISTKLVTVGGEYVFVAWDTSQATNMIRTFQSATSYNQPMSNWNVSNVIDFDNFLAGATAFSQYLGSWAVLPGIRTTSMFWGTQLAQDYPYLPTTPGNVEYTFYLSNSSNGWLKYVEGEPSEVLLSTAVISENVAIGTTVGYLSALGTDSPNLVYTISDNEFFEIADNERVVTKKVLDYESLSNFRIDILVYDTETQVSVNTSLLVALQDQTDEGDTTIKVTTSTSSGTTTILMPEVTTTFPTVIGDIVVDWGGAVPADTGPIKITNNAEGEDGSFFLFNNSTYELATKFNTEYDYEIKGTYNIEVTATTNTQAAYTQIITVVLSDVDEGAGTVFFEGEPPTSYVPLKAVYKGGNHISAGVDSVYAWYTVADSATADEVLIQGAETDTLTIENSMIGYKIKVSLTYTDVYSNEYTIHNTTADVVVENGGIPYFTTSFQDIYVQIGEVFSGEIVVFDTQRSHLSVEGKMQDDTNLEAGFTVSSEDHVSSSNEKVITFQASDNLSMGVYPIKILVKDGGYSDGVYTITNEFNFIVNDLPVIDTISDVTYQQTVFFNPINVNVTDSQSISTLEIAGNPEVPAWLTLDTQEDKKTGTISAADGVAATAGTWTITVTATDEYGGSSNEEFIITVHPNPDVTIVTIPVVRTGKAFETTAIIGSGSVEPYVFSISDTTKESYPWLDIVDGKVSGTAPTSMDSATIQFKIRVTDGNSISVEKSFDLTIEKNVKPVINISNNFVIQIGTTSFVDFTVTDEDDTVETSLTMRNGESIDSLTWLTFTIGANGKENGKITVDATDSGFSSYGKTELIVQSTDTSNETTTKYFDVIVNRPPLFTSSPIVSGRVGIVYTYTIGVFESDASIGDFVTLSVTTKPDWLSYSNNNLSGVPVIDGSYDITIKAEDSLGGVTEQDYAIVVVKNNPPEIIGIPENRVTLQINQAMSAINFSVTEQDGDSVTTTFGTLPAGITASINADGKTGGIISGTPTTPTLGGVDYVITISSTDGIGGNAEKQLSIYVNSPPLFDSAPITSIRANTLYSYTISASDPDEGDTVALSLSGTGNPTWLSLANGTLSGTAPGEVGSEHIVTIKATDSYGGEAIQNFTITVTSNITPSITQLDNVILQVGESLIVSSTVEDEDNAELTTTSTLKDGSALPDWLIFTVSNQGKSFSFTSSSLANDLAGLYEVTVSSSDAQNNVNTMDFTIRVNRPPQIVNDPPTSARTGIVYEYTIESTDADAGDTIISHAIEDAPAGMVLAGNKVTWTPQTATNAENIKLIVSDQYGGSSSKTFSISVALNSPPTITDVIDTIVQIDKDMTPLVVSVTDEDDASLILSATREDGTVLPLWLAFDINETGKVGTFSGKPPIDISEYSISIKVNVQDPAGGEDEDIFLLTINKPPVFNNVPLGEGRRGILYEHTVEVSDYEGNDISVSLVNPPPGMSIDTITKNITWTPTLAQVGNYQNIRIKAEDESGGIAEQTFSVNVVDNIAPSISPIQDKYFVSNQDIVNVTILIVDDDDSDMSSTIVIAVDDQGDEVNYPTWLDQPVLSSNKKNVTITGSNTSIEAAKLKVTSTDTTGDSASITFSIYITSAPPIIPILPDFDVYLANEFTSGIYTVASSTPSNNLIFSLKQSDGKDVPSWFQVNPSNYSFSFEGTPDSNLGDTLTIVLTVTDTMGNSSSEESFIVHVKQYVVGNTSIQMDTTTLSKFQDMSEESGKEIVKDFIASSIGEDTEDIEIISYSLNTGGSSLLSDTSLVRLAVFSQSSSSTPSIDVVYRVKTEETTENIKSELESNGDADQMVQSFNVVAAQSEEIQELTAEDQVALTNSFQTETTTVSDTTNAPATGIPVLKTSEGGNVVSQDDVLVGKTILGDVSGVSDEDGINDGSKVFAWIRRSSGVEEIIAGEVSNTYTLTDDDLGFDIAMRYSFQDIYGYESTFTSAFTAFIVKKKYEITTSSLYHTLIGAGQDVEITNIGTREVSSYNSEVTGYETSQPVEGIHNLIGNNGIWLPPPSDPNVANATTSFMYYTSSIQTSTQNLQMSEGWNLLGVSQNSTLEDIDNIVSGIYTYSDSKYVKQQDGTLLSHVGYIILCTSSGSINILNNTST